MDERHQGRAGRVLLTAAAFVVVVAGMRAAQQLLVPFLLAIFVSILAAPILTWLRRKGVGAGLSILAVVLLILASGAALVGVLARSFDVFAETVPVYEQELDENLGQFVAWLQQQGLDVSERTLAETFDPQVVLRHTASLVAELGSMLTNSLLILFTVIFILVEIAAFPTKVRMGFRNPEATLATIGRFLSGVNDYMSLKAWLSLLTGLSIGAWLALVGVEHPALWGVLAFMLNFVPNLGSIVAALPPVLLTLIHGEPVKCLWAAAGYLVVNLVVGNVLEPRFMGRGLGLSVLVVFLSLVFWGWVLGPFGMLLSVPLTMMVKIALEQSDDTRWLAVLLGTGSAGTDGIPKKS